MNWSDKLLRFSILAPRMRAAANRRGNNFAILEKDSMKNGLTIVLLASALTGGTAYANTGFYLGGSVGQGTIEDEESVSDGAGGFDDVEFDEDDLGYKLYAGYMLLPFLGVEGGYIDFGSPEGSFNNIDVELEADGFEGYVVGLLPLGPVELFAKVGMVAYDVEGRIDGAFGSASIEDDSEELAYGLGASFGFGHFKVRAEYQMYDVGEIDDLYMISAGLTYHFNE